VLDPSVSGRDPGIDNLGPQSLSFGASLNLNMNSSFAHLSRGASRTTRAVPWPGSYCCRMSELACCIESKRQRQVIIPIGSFLSFFQIPVLGSSSRSRSLGLA